MMDPLEDENLYNIEWIDIENTEMDYENYLNDIENFFKEDFEEEVTPKQENMETFRLISMTEFVLQQNKEFTKGKPLHETNWEKEFEKLSKLLIRYAEFLRQPLTLAMFVPVDEEVNVLAKPKLTVHQEAHFDLDEMEIYHKAQKKVLFEGFILNGEHLENKQLHLKIYIDTFEFVEYHDNGYGGGYIGESIENLSNCNLQITLTPSALKQIGL